MYSSQFLSICLLLLCQYFSLHAFLFNKLPQRSLKYDYLLHYQRSNSDLAEYSLEEMSKDSTDEVNKLLEAMPLSDKYTLLIQSYGSKFLEAGSKDLALLDKMESLFSELIIKGVAPEERSLKFLIDSSASTCNLQRISTTFTLLKQAGRLRGFGVVNGQLTTPPNLETVLLKRDYPSDQRETEIFAALTGLTLFTSYLIAQLAGFVIEDLHIYSNLFSVFLTFSVFLEIIFNKGSNLRIAAKGLERLIYKDEERQAHIDAAGFLAGYLVGLPCYPYTPDRQEALALVKDYPAAFEVYQTRPAKISIGSSGVGKMRVGGVKSSNSASNNNNQYSNNNNNNNLNNNPLFDKLIQEFRFPQTSKSNSTELALQQLSPIEQQQAEQDEEDLQQLSKDEKLLRIGRVLIWLFAPVAAETLKYGSTMFSDPRRPAALLSALLPSSTSTSSSSSSTASSWLADLLPSTSSSKDSKDSKESRESSIESLLTWAYFEATTLVKQYGDVLEDVRAYLRTGTSTVGETTLMLEEELIN